MSTPSLSIAFLLGSPDINGGTYVIYEHATRLQRLGHRVTMVTETAIDPVRYCWHPAAAELGWLTLGQAVEQEFDVVLATWWQSPFLLHRFSASHYVYFVQSIESRFFEKEDPANHDKRDLLLWQQFCESSYSFNIPVITEAKWIQQYLYQNYNTDAHLVRNGIRKDIYNEKREAVSARQEGRLRVLVEGPVDVFYKNVPKTIELSRQAGVDEIWLLTSSDIETFPGVDRVFSRIPIHDTPTIYRSCDVLVKLTYIEGMFGPPLEMFHCGGTAIVYDVAGHDEYIAHDDNSYVVPKDDDDQVVCYLQELKNNPDLLQRLKEGAAVTAQSWPDWQISSDQFAQALLEIIQQPGTPREYLESWTKKLQEDSATRFVAKTAQQFIDRESSRPDDTADTNNFVQLYYWQEQEGLQPEQVHWFHYTAGKSVSAYFDVTISGFPFWIRIDPSVRIGMIRIYSIEITNERTGEKVFSCTTIDGFAQLYVTGTLHPVEGNGANTYLSYGDDPQIVLPAVTGGEVGDCLHVQVALKEDGVARFIDFDCLSRECHSPVGAGGLSDLASSCKQMLSSVARFFTRRKS